VAGAPPSADPGAKAPWWPVSTVKFTVMTLGTLGIYHLYWLYDNWKRMRAAGAAIGSPFWRTFFAPFTAFGLFEKVRRDAQLHVVKTWWSAPGLALVYLVCNVALLVSAPTWLAGPLLLLPVLPVQLTMGRVNDAVAPGTERDGRFSVSNLVILALGLAITFALYRSEQLVDQLYQEWTP